MLVSGCLALISSRSLFDVAAGVLLLKMHSGLRRHIPDLDQTPTLTDFRHHPANIPHRLAEFRDLRGHRHRTDDRRVRRQRLQPKFARFNALNPEMILDFLTVLIRAFPFEVIFQQFKGFLGFGPAACIVSFPHITFLGMK